MTSITRPGTGTSVPTERRSSLAAVLLGQAEAAAWVRLAPIGVGALAAVLYLANLTISGFANTYYSAAALAASQSWSAWFFGSFDAANFITVDKPPLATMLMGLSVRLFGLSSWSILLPEAVAGIATVVVLVALVRRSFGPVAATIAGLVMALTPVAALIFRYNNPDALLTLLLVAAAWAFVRGLEDGRLRWIVAAAILVGFGFNTKYLQAYLVLPAFAITYLVAAPGRIRRRLGVLAVALVAVVLSSGWWVLAVELIPAAARPFIGGSTNDSALQLLLGYDGLSRIFGGSGGGPVGGGGGPVGGGGGPVGGPGSGFSGPTGILRLVNDQFGGQIGWLIPFALIGLVTGLAIRLRAARLDPARAGYLMWGLWLVVNGIVFSFMSGIIHSYYAIVLAPAIAALVGAGAVDLWALRSRFRFGGLAFALTVVVSAAWASLLLSRTFGFAPGLGIAILVVAGLVAVIVAVPASGDRRQTRLVAAGLGLAALLAGPASYTIATVATAYSGGDPRAGPATADGGFGGSTRAGGSVGAASNGTASALVTYLLANRGSATWIVATTSADSAATLELASGAPVMAMGGFSGTDPAPTLAAFKARVVSGQVRYVLVDSRGFGGAFGGFGGAFGGFGGGFSPGGSSASTAASIDAWASSAGRAVRYGGSGGILYDLSSVAAAGGS